MATRVKKIEWFQILVIVTSVFGMFLWGQRETNSSVRHLDGKIDNLTSVIHENMRDFHGRLLVLEEKYKKIRLEEEEM